MPNPRARIGLEPLDGRDCPSATAVLFNGTLTVAGDGTSQTIAVTESPDGSVLEAAGQSFDAGAVNRIVISAQGGDDTIQNETGKRAVIYAGSGNDTIFTGSAGGKVIAGHGNSTIATGGGRDLIWTGSGQTTVSDPSGQAVIHAGSPAGPVGNSALESQIIQLINNYRVANGVPALATSGQLNTAATMHSLDMAAVSNLYGPTTGMQHVLDGTGRPYPTDRLDAAGYTNWTHSYAWGENIAFGFPDAASVVSAWVNSPEHRANILNGTFTETGVSVRSDASGTLFFTQEFGHLG